MAFSLFVETLNIYSRKNARKPVKLREQFPVNMEDSHKKKTKNLVEK